MAQETSRIWPGALAGLAAAGIAIVFVGNSSPEAVRSALEILMLHAFLLLWWMRNAAELRAKYVLANIFIGGSLAGALALLLYKLVGLDGSSLEDLLAGPIEEFSKIVAFVFVMRQLHIRLTRQRVIAHAFAVALGFSFYENMMYLGAEAPWVLRALPGHLIYAAIWAPLAAKVFVDGRSRGWLVLGWLVAASVHALWNSSEFFGEENAGLYLLALLAILVLGLRRVQQACNEAGMAGFRRSGLPAPRS